VDLAMCLTGLTGEKVTNFLDGFIVVWT
jgi:hypothetical protein